jgi:hypothetical protein
MEDFARMDFIEPHKTLLDEYVKFVYALPSNGPCLL